MTSTCMVASITKLWAHHTVEDLGEGYSLLLPGHFREYKGMDALI